MNLAVAMAKTHHEEKQDEIDSFLTGTYWEQPVWNIDSVFFRESGIREPGWDTPVAV